MPAIAPTRTDQQQPANLLEGGQRRRREQTPDEGDREGNWHILFIGHGDIFPTRRMGEEEEEDVVETGQQNREREGE